MHKKLTIKSNIKNYDVEFFSKINEMPCFNPNAKIVIDSNVINLFPIFNRYDPIVIQCTEDAKTLQGATILLNELLKAKTTRYSNLVVIGGGIAQDIAGFCSSVFCRGIDYTLVPTTLLSQADSCIGGKTSINFEHKKNILGTFYPPSQILICKEFLSTLSQTDIISGLGEIYKFYILQNKMNKFSSHPNFLDETYSSLKYKKTILEIDEFDKKERQYLNFGHTFGHALEITSEHKIPHGIAVILGSIIAIRISSLLKYNVKFKELIYSTGINLIRNTNLHLDREWFNVENLIEIAKTDKKSNGDIKMVLMSDEPFLEIITNTEIISEAINNTYESI